MGFAMINFPLAKDFADFNRQFETLAVTVADNRCHLELLPRDAQAKKMLEALKFDFDTVQQPPALLRAYNPGWLLDAQRLQQRAHEPERSTGMCSITI